MSQNNENEFSNTPNEKQNLPYETENKEKVQDSNSSGKQKAAKRGKDIQCQKLELKMNKKPLNDPSKTNKQIEEKNTAPPTIYKDGLSVDSETDLPLVKRKRKERNNRGIPRLGNRDAANSLSVGGTGEYHACPSKLPTGKQFATPSLIDQSSAKSTPSVNTAESFDGSDVPYENLETNPKISLALIDPSSNASEDASDVHCQSDLTDPAEEYVPTRYENNSSYAAAIRGGTSLSLSESWKGALETSCSSSIQGSHESLKYDTSQQDDHTLRGNISTTPSASPTLYHRHENVSPLSGGNIIIPLITTNLSGKDTSHSPSSSFIYRRKFSHGSNFTRQQSQPSPIDQRYMYRGIRRSISNKMPTNEEAMLRHVCSLGGIETEERSGCCLKKHHCCSLHNCGIPTNAYYIEENQREHHDGSPCNHLHVQNEPNLHFQCHHGHTSSSRICRNGACRDTTTHIIGSSLCINQGADSIATIAADSLKFKGATKKFNQV